jgi:hypothetical protein
MNETESRIYKYLQSPFKLSFSDEILSFAYRVGDARFFESKMIPKADRQILEKFLAENTKDLKLGTIENAYHNAQYLVIKSATDKDLQGRLQYCEGYFTSISHPLLVSHAWLILDKEYVIDIDIPTTQQIDAETLPWKKIADAIGFQITPTNTILGQIPIGAEYFGICVDVKHLAKKKMKSESTLEFLNEPRGNFAIFKKYIKFQTLKNKK